MNTGIAAFDSTLQSTNQWLNDVMDRMGWKDRQRAYQALRVVLHALRDHLPIEQAAALGAQLPMLIRGFYYEGWHPHNKPLKDRKKEAFLAAISQASGEISEIKPEELARIVFQVLAMHVSPGEIKHVKLTLPHELRDLWAEGTHSLWF
jgi:uncharacterized protein (DUF2267 family)